MPKRDYQDFRNYDKEAADLIVNLRNDELYRLYEIVIEEQKRRMTDTREKELNAVRKVIEGKRGLDQFRLQKIAQGYRSSMAADARAKDGNTRPNKRRV